jgi:hypothetical protein
MGTLHALLEKTDTAINSFSEILQDLRNENEGILDTQCQKIIEVLQDMKSYITGSIEVENKNIQQN